MSAVDEETKRAAIEIFQREGIAAAQAHAGVVPSTIYIAPNSTSRHCRTCKSQRNAERQKRLREERAA